MVITCVKRKCLCVLRWLIRPIWALNCLLQIEHERSEEESSVGDALALTPLSTFLIGFADFFASYSSSYEALPFCLILCSLLSRGFEGVLVSLLLTTMEAFSYL